MYDRERCIYHDISLGDPHTEQYTFYKKRTLGPFHIVCGTDGVTPPRMSYKGSWWKGNGYFDLSYVCVPATWNRKKSCGISDASGK